LAAAAAQLRSLQSKGNDEPGAKPAQFFPLPPPLCDCESSEAFASPQAQVSSRLRFPQTAADMGAKQLLLNRERKGRGGERREKGSQGSSSASQASTSAYWYY